MSEAPRPSTCPSCGRPILWARNDQGKMAPFDGRPSQMLLLADEGLDLGEDAHAVVKGHLIHFVQCGKPAGPRDVPKPPAEDTSRVCAWHGCTHNLRDRRAFCTFHYKKLPPAMQNRVKRAIKEADPNAIIAAVNEARSWAKEKRP